MTPLQAESRAEARSEDPRGKKKKGEKFRRALGRVLMPPACKLAVCGSRFPVHCDGTREALLAPAEKHVCTLRGGMHAHSSHVPKMAGGEALISACVSWHGTALTLTLTPKPPPPAWRRALKAQEAAKKAKQLSGHQVGGPDAAEGSRAPTTTQTREDNPKVPSPASCCVSRAHRCVLLWFPAVSRLFEAVAPQCRAIIPSLLAACWPAWPFCMAGVDAPVCTDCRCLMQPRQRMLAAMGAHEADAGRVCLRV